MTQARHLLLLGSNRSDDALVHQAIGRLRELGRVSCLTEVHHLPSDSGDGAHYFNILVALETELPTRQLTSALKHMERALGRDPADNIHVAIDIDLLATFTDGRWARNAHADAKGEFQRGTVRRLLAEAAIAQPLASSEPDSR